MKSKQNNVQEWCQTNYEIEWELFSNDALRGVKEVLMLYLLQTPEVNVSVDHES